MVELATRGSFRAKMPFEGNVARCWRIAREHRRDPNSFAGVGDAHVAAQLKVRAAAWKLAPLIFGHFGPEQERVATVETRQLEDSALVAAFEVAVVAGVGENGAVKGMLEGPFGVVLVQVPRRCLPASPKVARI